MPKPSVRLRVATVSTAAIVGPVALLAGSDVATSAPIDDGARDAGKNLVLRPGAVGKAKVGMTIKRAMRTGLFKRNGVCGPLQPKGKLNRQFGTFVHKRRLVGMKITGKNIRTKRNVGLNTRLKRLRAVYGKRLVGPRRGADGLWILHVRKGKRYLGFLLGTRPKARPKPGHKVTYMEVTKGRKPTLYPSGC